MLNGIVTFLLDLGYKLTGNYGVAMILFAILLRVVLMPLDIKSRKANRLMQKIQPEINRINKKYEKDQQQKTRKTQELYKKEGFSPTASCLPMLIQLPVLFIIFAALRAYVLNTFSLPLVQHMEAGNTAAIAELFRNSRFLWVQNVFSADTLAGNFKYAFPQAAELARLSVGLPNAFLDMKAIAVPVINDIFAGPGLAAARISANSAPFADGYNAFRDLYLQSANVVGTSLNKLTNGLFILPLLSGGLQFLQGWLSQRSAPKNPDNPNAGSMKMMTYLFPLLSVWICATYTSLFTLYWITGSLCAIALQLYLDWHFKREDQKAGIAVVRSGKK